MLPPVAQEVDGSLPPPVYTWICPWACYWMYEWMSTKISWETLHRVLSIPPDDWLAPGMAASAVSIWVCACEWGFSRKVLWVVGRVEKHYINDVHLPFCTSLVFLQSDLSSPRPTYTSIPICLQSGNIGQFLFGSRIEGDHRPWHKHTSALTHRDLSLCLKSNLLVRPRWKEHYVYPVVCFHSLCDSSLMLLTEINRAFNSHSSGSCASNYAAYAIKHKYWESHGFILRIFWPGGNPSDKKKEKKRKKKSDKGTEAQHNHFDSVFDGLADSDSHYVLCTTK